MDPNWDSMLIDASVKEVTRLIRANICENHRNGWMGRQLSGMFGEAGLVDVSVIPLTVVISDLAQAGALLINAAPERAMTDGSVMQTQVSAWRADLEYRAGQGRFFSCLTGFIVGGRKP